MSHCSTFKFQGKTLGPQKDKPTWMDDSSTQPVPIGWDDALNKIRAAISKELE